MSSSFVANSSPGQQYGNDRGARGAGRQQYKHVADMA